MEATEPKAIPDLPAISKRQRFEIFKRDKFTCLYCGQKPPQIVLNVDHVIPRSKGGDNSETNLITSCRDCNGGKSDVPLSELPQGHLETVAIRQEKLEQMRALSQLCIDEKAELERQFQVVSDHWLRLMNDDPNEFVLSGEHAKAARRFLKMLSLDQVLEALDSSYANVGSRSEYQHFKYFCGACWRMIRKDPPVNGKTDGE